VKMSGLNRSTIEVKTKLGDEQIRKRDHEDCDIVWIRLELSNITSNVNGAIAC